MLEAVDGELCRPELREWLLSSAEISLRHIDRLLELLDDQYVATVKDLALWATLASFDKYLVPVAAAKIRDALARQEIGTCSTESTSSPTRGLPAEVEEEITPPATPLKAAVLPPAARPCAQRSLRLGPSVECARRTAAVLRLQAVARGWLARVLMREAELVEFLVRAELLVTLRLQAAGRGLLARALARRSVRAAAVLQASVRGMLARQGEPWLRASARAARRAHRLPAAATLLQAGARGLLARAAQRSQWQRSQKKARVARLNAAAEAAEAAADEVQAAAARDEAAALAARDEAAIAAQAAVSTIQERQRRAAAAAAAGAAAAAAENKSETKLWESTCTGVTTLHDLLHPDALETTTQSSPTTLEARSRDPWLGAPARISLRFEPLSSSFVALRAEPLLGRTARRCASSPAVQAYGPGAPPDAQAAAARAVAEEQRRRLRAETAAAAAGAAAVAVENIMSETKLRESTCTGVTYPYDLLHPDALETTTRPSSPAHDDELCMNCLADTIDPSNEWRCTACEEAFVADRLGDGMGMRCESRFSAAREEVGRLRAAAAAAAAAVVPPTTVPPKKLRGKKQAAQAAIEAEAEREFQARYDDHQHWMLADMSEYYGSEGFDRPPSDVYSYGGGYFGDDGAGA